MAANKRKLKEKVQLWFLTKLLKIYFLTEQYLLKIKSINYPKGQFLFSMWHRHQCLVYGVKDKSKFYALISASNDGEVIAKAAESLNIKSVRGSTNRHGVSASLELIEKLKDGNSAAIMVDGPRGPIGKVKEGIINIAKLSNIPIIPVAWYSKDKTFFTLNTWDKFIAPVGYCRTVALYGDPIYIPADTSKEDMTKWAQKVSEEMNRLQKDLEENYEKYLKL